MPVSIFPVNYQLRTHDNAGRHHFIKPSLNVENITNSLNASGFEKKLVSGT